MTLILILVGLVLVLGVIAGFFIGAAATRQDCDQQIKDVRRWIK